MLCELYQAMMATNTKVLSDIELSCANEQRVLGYLRQYWKSSERCASRACTDPIRVTFNNQDGTIRRPTAHTCACYLLLMFRIQGGISVCHHKQIPCMVYACYLVTLFLIIPYVCVYSVLLKRLQVQCTVYPPLWSAHN